MTVGGKLIADIYLRATVSWSEWLRDDEWGAQSRGCKLGIKVGRVLNAGYEVNSFILWAIACSFQKLSMQSFDIAWW